MRQTRWSTAASDIARCDDTKLLPSPGAALLTTSTLPGSSVSPQASITLARRRRKASPGSGDMPDGRIGLVGRRRRHQRQHRQAEPALDVVGRVHLPAQVLAAEGAADRADDPQQPGRGQTLVAPRADRRRGRLGGIDDADGAAVGGAGQDRFLGLLQQGVEDLAGADRFALERRVGHALPVEVRGLGLLRVQGAGEAVLLGDRRLVLGIDAVRRPWRSRPAAVPAPTRAPSRPGRGRGAWGRAARPAGRPGGSARRPAPAASGRRRWR